MNTMSAMEMAQTISRGRQIAQRRQRHTQDAARAHGEHLADVHQVAGEEDDQQDLGELPRLKAERPDVHPEPGPVDLLSQGTR